MPLYEYECTACHRHTEKIQKFSDPEITTCPYCGGTLQRVISAPAFALKGGGWYADGYGSKKPAASGGSAEGSTSSEGSSAAEGGTSAGAADSGKAAASPASAPASNTPAAPASSPAPAASKA